MSDSIITYLLNIINFLCEIILDLSTQLDNILAHSKSPDLTPPDHLDYQLLTVDDLPIIKSIDKKDYRLLLQEYEALHGKPCKPIKRHGSKTQVDEHITCPCCQAPSIYLYINNGDKGQYRCKICLELFNQKNRFSKDIALECPHCQGSLDLIKHREGFVIYKCRHKQCPYYQDRLKKMSVEEKKRFKQFPYEFKMHYIFRDFALNLSDLEDSTNIPTVVQLSNIHCSPRALGLILTYCVNYGLSAEKTAALMFDVHELKISGQTIRNYQRSAGALVQPFTTNFPYQLSDQFCGDETYIRVQGKWHYVFFFFDAVNKIILSNRVSPKRSTQTAIRAIWDVLKRFDKIPEKLELIVDGNPIYKLAQAFFAQHDKPFDIIQVIGLTNDDPVSTEYRPLKQIIERLNRTFKGNYKPLGGFGSQSGSIAHVELFAAYFNFLRPHSALDKNSVPVQLPELQQCNNMPQKWIRLLNLAQDYLMAQQPIGF